MSLAKLFSLEKYPLIKFILVNAFTNTTTFKSNPPDGELLLLFDDGLNLPSNLKVFISNDSRLLLLLFPNNRLLPSKFSNDYHLELLISVFCLNALNSLKPIFCLSFAVIPIIILNILSKFSNIVTIG